ncbi:MAG TPA: tRNA pseudouridine(55) synthase TruB [Actinomycetota bacterium]|nr:tRNA pseudouridine(55) synthase TruB [Actinomycetota bacterium]
MDGVLIIDKPAGMTSHDVVDRVRKALKTKKVGHAGTLDPDATGLLLIGVGKATRFLTYAQSGPKRYVADARFGIVTTSQDASGEVVRTSDGTVTSDHVRGALAAFTGEIRQLPPMVSAVKVGGERLYAKARRGEEIERAPRTVTIHSLELVAFDASAQTARLDVSCSGGTYVRTLIHDLGEALGVGAHMTALRRTEIGGFSLSDALALDDVATSRLLPLHEAVRPLPKIKLGAAHARDVGFGRALPGDIGPDLDDGARAAVTFDDELVAVYRRAGDHLVPDRVVSQ